jgi:uncharacterized protein (TIRG00374 family)
MILLLWWVLRGTDPQTLWDQAKQASLGGLVLAGVLNVGHNVFRVWRWRSLLEPVRRGVPFRPMFSAVILGYMTTWIIPGRLGELVRPAILAGRERLPIGACLGSVLADRLFDGLSIVVLFAVGMQLTPLHGEAARHAVAIRWASIGLVAAIAAPIVVLLVASGSRAALERWIGARRGLVRWGGRLVLEFSRGIEAVRSPRLLVGVCANSLAAWLTIALGLWIGIRSCGADIPFGAMLVLMPLTALGVALPTPGGAGGFHAAIVFGLTQLYGVAQPVAVGAGFLVHFAVVLPVILLGTVLLVVDRVPLRDMLDAARQVKNLGSSAAPDPAVGPAVENAR